MSWEVEYTDEFGRWWATLSDDEQESVAAYVELLADDLYDAHLEELRREGLIDG